MIERRSFLKGVAAALAAPAIVHAGNLMPIKPVQEALPMLREIDIVSNPEFQEFLEGMSQRMVATIFYGNPDWEPMQFAGFRAA